MGRHPPTPRTPACGFGRAVRLRAGRSTGRFGVDWPIWRRLADLASIGRFKKGFACPSKKKMKFSAFWTTANFREIFERKFRFLQISRGFWRAIPKRTSKSTSTSNFAQDRLFLRLVPPKMMAKRKLWILTSAWVNLIWENVKIVNSDKCLSRSDLRKCKNCEF